MVGSERAQRMSFACRITKATITIRICNTYHFSTVTVLRNLRINDRHCLLSPNSVFISDSQYSSWSSSWKHDEMKTCLDASVSDVHLGCLMTIGSTVSSFALFRARKRDLTDGGSEAWASCRQTDRQPETVGHVHVVLGLALPAGAILAEYLYSSLGLRFFNTVLRIRCFPFMYTLVLFCIPPPVQCSNTQTSCQIYSGGRQLFAVVVVIIMRLQAGRSRVRFSMASLELFIDLILPATLSPCGRLSL